MADLPLPADVRDLLGKPNPAVIVTLRKDGQPVSVATWYLFEDDRVLVNMDASRKRLDHLRHDPRVSLTALAEGDWYTHVSVQGKVVDLVDDEDLGDIDRLSRHYTGKPYANRVNRRISAWVELESWHGWGEAARS
jgi:PPOX class probable F420-dependent enzyme